MDTARHDGAPSRRRIFARQVGTGAKGSTLVEFALVVLVFMTMVLGVIDFSRALYSYHYISNMARNATRWAAVNGYMCSNDGSCPYSTGASASDIESYVQNHVPTGIPVTMSSANPPVMTNPSVTVSWPLQSDSPDVCNPSSSSYISSNYPGCTVEVQISYQFPFVFPLVHVGSITMSSSSEMVISH